MARIRATCSDCGDIELDPPELHARVCVDNGSAAYRFCCPECQMVSIKDSDPRTVDMLASAGVPVEEWALPAELDEKHGGQRINHDDIISFHELLGDDEALADELRKLVGNK